MDVGTLRVGEYALGMSDLLGAAAALVEAGASMQEPDFYDAAMTGAGEPAMLPWQQSPWLPIYMAAARMVPSDTPVVDLGCGTGRFLAYLSQQPRGLLTGVDFSPAAIAEARQYLLDLTDEDQTTFYHRFRLQVSDLRTWTPTYVPPTTVFTCLEVLEHLVDDLDVISNIPEGHRLVFSVPSYLSASHVRCFPSIRSVYDRFHHLLLIRRWQLVDFGKNMVVHVCDSTRKPVC